MDTNAGYPAFVRILTGSEHFLVAMSLKQLTLVAIAASLHGAAFADTNAGMAPAAAGAATDGYGLCPDGVTPKTDPAGTNCPMGDDPNEGEDMDKDEVESMDNIE